MSDTPETDKHTHSGSKLAEHARRMERERDQLRTQLDAWHSVFGTSQLSHAQARLEAAERIANSEFDGSHPESA